MMAPAFSSMRQAAGFCLLMLLVLLAPLLIPLSWLPSRADSYSSLGWDTGEYPWVRHEIFEEKGDIDIAFMGCSRIYWDIDTAHIEDALGAKLGRKATVRTIGWSFDGFDQLYFVMQDLLQKRKVRMIVFPDLSYHAKNAPHAVAHYFFRIPDNGKDLAGLSLKQKLSYYGCAVLGMPRNLLNTARPCLPIIPSEKVNKGLTNIDNPDLHLGAFNVRQLSSGAEFVDAIPSSQASPADACIYSDATKEMFHFSEGGLPSLQAAFAHKVGLLAEKYSVSLVYLHLPTIEDLREATVNEPVYWPKCLGQPVRMVGIPSATLFAGMSDNEASDLFYDHVHLNENGQKYFTPLMTPSLVQLYEETNP